MTQGEVAFYLREIHGHWTASTVSSDKLGELAEAKLIELQEGQVRLTSAGQQRKIAGRSRYNTTLSLSRSRDSQPRTFRKRSAVTKPKPLV